MTTHPAGPMGTLYSTDSTHVLLASLVTAQVELNKSLLEAIRELRGPAAATAASEHVLPSGPLEHYWPPVKDEPLPPNDGGIFK